MLDIGLTGGIGSGKSTAAQMLVDLGAVLIDADVLAREVVRPGTPALAALRREFGPSVLTTAGKLDRPALAALVFGDPAARERVNAIIHPAVREAAAARAREARESDPTAIIVEDIPLLVETSGQTRFHIVIVIETPVGTRLERLAERGLDPAAARARIASQADDATRAAAADVVIRNDGTPEELRRRVTEVWHEHILPLQRKLLAGA